MECRSTSSFRLVDASSRWAENNTRRWRWWNEMLMSLKLIACGDRPPSVDPFKHKRDKITMYTLSKPALLQISQCPHFPCLSWTATSFLHLSLSCTHTHSHGPDRILCSSKPGGKRQDSFLFTLLFHHTASVIQPWGSMLLNSSKYYRQHLA